MSEENNSAPISNSVPAPTLEDSLRVKAAEAPKTATDKKDFLGPKFAALTRKEKEIREMQKSYETKHKELSEKETKYSAWEQDQKDPNKDWKVRLKSSPLEALKEAGLSIEELFEAYNMQENPTPEMLIRRSEEQVTSKMQKELNAMKATMADKEAKEAELVAQKERDAYDNVVTHFKKEISAHVEQNLETYELIQANNAQDLVFQVIEEHHKSSGRILTVEDAAKAVESHLEDEARKVFELKRFKQPAKPEQSSETKTAPTLSNTMSAQVPERAEKVLSREERLAKAAKMLKFNG